MRHPKKTTESDGFTHAAAYLRVTPEQLHSVLGKGALCSHKK